MVSSLVLDDNDLSNCVDLFNERLKFNETLTDYLHTCRGRETTNEMPCEKSPLAA